MDITSLQFAKARPWSFTAVAYDIRWWCEIFYDWLWKESLSVNILHLMSSYIQRKIIKNGLNVNLRFKSSGMWYCVSVSTTQNFEEPYYLHLWGQAVQKKNLFCYQPNYKASHPRRPESPATPQQKPQVSYFKSSSGHFFVKYNVISIISNWIHKEQKLFFSHSVNTHILIICADTGWRSLSCRWSGQ